MKEEDIRLSVVTRFTLSSCNLQYWIFIKQVLSYRQQTFYFAAGSKRLPKTSLMILLESLQRFLGIVPAPPKKRNTTEFTSCFIVCMQ